MAVVKVDVTFALGRTGVGQFASELFFVRLVDRFGFGTRTRQVARGSRARAFVGALVVKFFGRYLHDLFETFETTVAVFDRRG